MARDYAAWMALAYRSALPTPEQVRIAHSGGPRIDDYPAEVIEREAEDGLALTELGVRLIAATDDDFPEELQDSHILLQIAGRPDLMWDRNVRVLAGHKQLGEVLDEGDRALVVLSKGLLKARTLLRALHEPIENGQVTLLSAEPPRASWGPIRDRRRDAIVQALNPS